MTILFATHNQGKIKLYRELTKEESLLADKNSLKPFLKFVSDINNN